MTACRAFDLPMHCSILYMYILCICVYVVYIYIYTICVMYFVCLKILQFNATAPHRVWTEVKFLFGMFQWRQKHLRRESWNKHLFHKGKQLCEQTRLWNFKLLSQTVVHILGECKTSVSKQCSEMARQRFLFPRWVWVSTKHMYEIELVEAEKERVKIHYIGYSDKYDEWKLKARLY